ncbi:MAG: ATP-binding protein [Thiopseudomonas sp.]|nr:ATP-binding protein [Thiopseudomonas sp.]MCK9465604.1 ATP-binding protein [Thiopseudomonas sp.]
MSANLPLRVESEPDAVHSSAPVSATPADLAAISQLSASLAQSLELMQQRYAQIQDELASVSRQRLDELAEKERLAQRLQSTLDALPSGVIVLDAQGYVRQANPAAQHILQVELTGRLWRDLILQCFQPQADDGHEISLRNGKRISLAIQSLHGEPGQLILLTDLTHTRQLQDQLAHQGRLSALGKMTAALAHQIRTPLSAALLYAEHLQEPLPEPMQQRFAQRVQQSLYELERQIRDMLLFARGPLPLEEQLTAQQLLSALQQAAEPHISGRQVRWCLSAPAAQLRCSQDMLIGALMNLLHNALQAAAQQAVKVHIYRKHKYLRIAVVDNGPGMSADILQQAGEDFFSRKSTGTGLGLMVVQAVAKAHQGQFMLRSKAGWGTCAILQLPLMPQAQEAGEY